MYSHHHLSSFNLPHTQNYVDWPSHSWDIAEIFKILKPDWLRVFLNTPSLTFINHVLCFLNLYLQAKNEVDSLIFSLDIPDLRILQSAWLGVFCLMNQNSPRYGPCTSTEIIAWTVEHQIQKKVITKFLEKLTKPLFWRS